MTNEDRAEAIRVALAKLGINHGDVASAIGKERQNVSRIALSGKPGTGCEIRQALAKLVGRSCGMFWGCEGAEEEAEEGESMSVINGGNFNELEEGTNG